MLRAGLSQQPCAPTSRLPCESPTAISSAIITPLAAAGIEVAETLFSLDDMVVKFEQLKSEIPQVLTLLDLVGMARAGTAITMAIVLEALPAVGAFCSQGTTRKPS